MEDGVVLLVLDCNGGSGSFAIDGEELTITDVISTLTFCGEESLDQQFSTALQAAIGWAINTDASDQLALTLDEDGAQMLFSASLTGVVWEWTEFRGGDDSIIVPDSPANYTIEFLDEGAIQVRADCNSGMGTATVDGNEIELAVSTTRMACPESSSSAEYLRILDDASSFVIRDGVLHLNLPMDGGEASFQAIPPSIAGASATPEA